MKTYKQMWIHNDKYISTLTDEFLLQIVSNTECCQVDLLHTWKMKQIRETDSDLSQISISCFLIHYEMDDQDENDC